MTISLLRRETAYIHIRYRQAEKKQRQIEEKTMLLVTSIDYRNWWRKYINWDQQWIRKI